MQVPQYVVCCSLAGIFSSMRDMTTILRKDVRNWLDWPPESPDNQYHLFK